MCPSLLRKSIASWIDAAVISWFLRSWTFISSGLGQDNQIQHLVLVHSEAIIGVKLFPQMFPASVIPELLLWGGGGDVLLRDSKSEIKVLAKLSSPLEGLGNNLLPSL